MVRVVLIYGPTSPRLRADLSSLTTCLGPSCPRAELSGTPLVNISALYCRPLFCLFVPFLLVIVLHVLRVTASDYSFGYLSFELRLPITRLGICPSSYGFPLPVWVSVLRVTASDYPFGYPSFELRLPITRLGIFKRIGLLF